MIRKDKINRVIGTIQSAILKNMDIAIIGNSGGVDSTLLTTLAVEALGVANVYGFGMPANAFDEDTFNSRSQRLANKLGYHYQVAPIGTAVATTRDMIEDVIGEHLSSLNFGNIKSRMRMVFLYSFAAALAESTGKRVRVLGTGNLSEDFIGYDTKGGDALADIFPIGRLFKSEVYQLAGYYVSKGTLTEDLIDRIPSAGLEDGQTDETDLGYTYDSMEEAIRFFENHPEELDVLDFGITPKVATFVKKRHLANKHKHEAPPVVQIPGEWFTYDCGEERTC
jgi:NAD+ synthase